MGRIPCRGGRAVEPKGKKPAGNKDKGKDRIFAPSTTQSLIEEGVLRDVTDAEGTAVVRVEPEASIEQGNSVEQKSICVSYDTIKE